MASPIEWAWIPLCTQTLRIRNLHCQSCTHRVHVYIHFLVSKIEMTMEAIAFTFIFQMRGGLHWRGCIERDGFWKSGDLQVQRIWWTQTHSKRCAGKMGACTHGHSSDSHSGFIDQNSPPTRCSGKCGLVLWLVLLLDFMPPCKCPCKSVGWPADPDGLSVIFIFCVLSMRENSCD